ncbi:MAG: DUF924 family protein [Sphingobium sp.]
MTERSQSQDAVTAPWATDLLNFWFGQVGEAGWWSHDPALDAACTARFADLWAAQRTRPAADFLDRADHALAAILLFDQLPRNMFRDQAQAFATDPLARDIARGAVAQGYDVQIGGAGRTFFYMPFQHSEDIDDQALSLRLFEGAGDEKSLAFARDHHAVIERFGRFPHRNAALGRQNRPGEAEAIAQGSAW